MLKQIMKTISHLFLSLGLIGILALFFSRLITSLYAVTRIFSVEQAPSEHVAIVFGAGLRRDGSPTAILRDRVQTAARLFFDGKVEKLLLSGDHHIREYNEPEAMRQYALSLGVPDEALVLDYAGRRTYDTCYRAKAIFGVQSAILVTQPFHLPRALFTCTVLGLKAVGVQADNLYYRRILRAYWNMRELFATLGAFVDVYIYKPVPVLGKPEPIFAEKSFNILEFHR
jgi:SanA protein